MNIQGLFVNTTRLVKEHSPELLTAAGVTGVVTTSYLVGKASFEAAEALSSQDGYWSNKEKIKFVWKKYIPATLSGLTTVGCIIVASKVKGRRTAAAVAAYSITEKAFTEYKEKVVEEFGKNKAQKVQDQIAQDRVTSNPSGSKEVIITGSGQVMCCELYTHRYFRSDMETLRKAQNDINARLLREMYVNLDELYELLGLPSTSHSGDVGWISDKQLDLELSTVISEAGEPCLAFTYNYIKPLH